MASRAAGGFRPPGNLGRGVWHCRLAGGAGILWQAGACMRPAPMRRHKEIWWASAVILEPIAKDWAWLEMVTGPRG